MSICFNLAKATELKQNEASKEAHYGAIIGLVDNMSVFDTCYYYKPSGYWVPAYNAGTDNVDTKLTAKTVTSKLTLTVSKFNNAIDSEKESYGFTKWAKDSKLEAIQGFPMPENFIAVTDNDVNTVTNTNTNVNTSLTGSVFGSSSVLMLGILFAVSVAAVAAAIVYKKKRKL